MSAHPNIAQVTTHDSGRHFGCYGHATLNTPVIDGLAADGVRLSNYFAASPICCASRATQLTGRHPQSHGLLDLCFFPFDWRLNDNERHFDAPTAHNRLPATYEHLLQMRGGRLVELYDLQSDPLEFNNLAYSEEHQDVREQMDQLLWSWMESVEDPSSSAL